MTEEKSKNPWLTMWTQPRSTIRSLINTDPKRSIFWLSTIYILQTLLFMANYNSLGLNYHFALILIIAIVLSPFIGAIWLYLFGWILYFTGRWLKGQASMMHLRCVLAWSKIPILINLAMWFILLVFSANYVFIQFSSGPSLFFINLISIISGVWSLVLLILGLREAQNFSVGRAIGNWVLFLVFGILFSFAITMVLNMALEMIT